MKYLFNIQTLLLGILLLLSNRAHAEFEDFRGTANHAQVVASPQARPTPAQAGDSKVDLRNYIYLMHLYEDPVTGQIKGKMIKMDPKKDKIPGDRVFSRWEPLQGDLDANGRPLGKWILDVTEPNGTFPKSRPLEDGLLHHGYTQMAKSYVAGHVLGGEPLKGRVFEYTEGKDRFSAFSETFNQGERIYLRLYDSVTNKPYMCPPQSYNYDGLFGKD